MGKKSKIITLGGGTKVYLRLTLAGQEELAQLDPDASVLANILAAIDTPSVMAKLLTECLNFKGNENTILDGVDLYDALVDDGYQGVEDWGALILDMCRGSGLLKQEDTERMQRVINHAAKVQSDTLDAASANPEEAALGEQLFASEGAADPLTLPTLDG